MLLTWKAQHIQEVVPSDAEHDRPPGPLDSLTPTSVQLSAVDGHPGMASIGSLENGNETEQTTPQHESSACKIVDKGKEKSVELERGRTYERGPRYPNPLDRATSRCRRNDPAIEVDVRPMEKRSGSRSTTFFEDPSDPCAAFEDNLLEPCPHIPICRLLSEVLETPVDAANEILLLSSPFDVSFERPKFDRRPSRAPTTIAAKCRNSDPVIFPSQASMLPTEILQHIYDNLTPADFNSADTLAGHGTSIAWTTLYWRQCYDEEVIRTLFPHIPLTSTTSRSTMNG
jgi:hypothetical protein